MRGLRARRRRGKLAGVLEAPLSTPAARQARARILGLTRSELDAEQLNRLASDLQKLVPFSASFWAGSDPSTTLARAPACIDLPYTSDRECARFWEREFLTPDFNLFRDLARADQPFASLHRVTEGQLTRSQRYREMHQSMGLGDELRGVFRTGETTWGMVALWRDAGQTPFSPAEEKLLSDLSAPIGEAFRRSALLRLATDQTTPEGPGLLVFDRDGALLSYNQQALAWLDELPQTPGEPAAGCWCMPCRCAGNPVCKAASPSSSNRPKPRKSRRSFSGRTSSARENRRSAVFWGTA
jgi:hypothetical protein